MRRDVKGALTELCLVARANSEQKLGVFRLSGTGFQNLMRRPRIRRRAASVGREACGSPAIVVSRINWRSG